ncbi:hypothetical protein HanXRQr2_Chr09g0370741 [Helianthus annuus]|uniref:Uncharacterized protein n=1 Tax=Helianthus annuus TaxID=4232 RepID=A0A9K3N7P8_HELAN|nr:hypothetical protein HanXRQr2_Chr09g0370741 [Helianthus annuus]KAJ0891703.1 hypothetical protein HanPSC8_Chr09g0357151 [Helianthus annuus]
MDSFSSFFDSQSQSASRNSWTYDPLKNFDCGRIGGRCHGDKRRW